MHEYAKFKSPIIAAHGHAPGSASSPLTILVLSILKSWIPQDNSGDAVVVLVVVVVVVVVVLVVVVIDVVGGLVVVWVLKNI